MDKVGKKLIGIFCQVSSAKKNFISPFPICPDNFVIFTISFDIFCIIDASVSKIFFISISDSKLLVLKMGYIKLSVCSIFLSSIIPSVFKVRGLTEFAFLYELRFFLFNSLFISWTFVFLTLEFSTLVLCWTGCFFFVALYIIKIIIPIMIIAVIRL